MSTQNPWDKLPTETTKAHLMFKQYLEMGAEGSLRKLVQKLNKKKSYFVVLSKWSSKHKWPERRDAYLLYLEQEHHKQWEKSLLKERLKLRKRELEDSKNLAHYARRVLNQARDTPLESVVTENYSRDEEGKVLEVIRTHSKPHDILTNVLPKLDLSSKLGRRALSMSINTSQKIELEHKDVTPKEGPDFSKFSDSELELFLKLLEKCELSKLEEVKQNSNVIPLAN